MDPTEQANQGCGPDKNIGAIAEQVDANSQYEDLAVSEEIHRAISEWVVESDFSELTDPVPVYKGDQSEEDKHYDHCAGIQIGCRVFGEFAIDVSVDTPVNGEEMWKVVVQNKRSCET